jgi:hypothetical protein
MHTTYNGLAPELDTPLHNKVVASFESKTPNAHERHIHILVGDGLTTGSAFLSVSKADAIAACKTIIGAAQ